MKIIKRDGTCADYDRAKIVTALEKANAEVQFWIKSTATASTVS